MLKKLIDLFVTENPAEGSAPPDKEVAAAALMVEAALMDGQMDSDEEQTIRRLLQAHFDLSPADCALIFKQAKEAQADTNHLLRFTRLVKDHFTPEERIDIMQMLWQVAYADGEIHHYESNLMRRIAGLIYVSDRDNGQARKRAANALSTADDAS